MFRCFVGPLYGELVPGLVPGTRSCGMGLPCWAEAAGLRSQTKVLQKVL